MARTGLSRLEVRGRHALRPAGLGGRRNELRRFLQPSTSRQGRSLDGQREEGAALKRYVEGVGANFGRVRVIRLEPQDRRVAKAMLHRDQNNRYNPDGAGWIVRSWLELSDNPDSYMMLMDSDADGYPDPTTEIRIPLHRGSRFVVDTQRLWHVVVHRGDQPRHVDLQFRVRAGTRFLDPSKPFTAGSLATAYPGMGEPLKALRSVARRRVGS